MEQSEHQAQKVGKYERPALSSTGTVIGVLALIIVLIVLAIIIF
jgi:subtilase family serine protease